MVSQSRGPATAHSPGSRAAGGAGDLAGRLEIAFASGGDIWTVPASGGDARLLVSDPATESRPHWSPDGRRLAFVSTRTGGGDIYVLTLETGDVRRLTLDDCA